MVPSVVRDPGVSTPQTRFWDRVDMVRSSEVVLSAGVRCSSDVEEGKTPKDPVDPVKVSEDAAKEDGASCPVGDRSLTRRSLPLRGPAEREEEDDKGGGSPPESVDDGRAGERGPGAEMKEE